MINKIFDEEEEWMVFSSYIERQIFFKKKISVSGNTEKLETSYIASGVQNTTAAKKSTLEIPQKTCTQIFRYL